MKSFLWRILGVGVPALVVLGLVWVACRSGPDCRAVVQNSPEPAPDATSEARRAQRLEVTRQVLSWVAGKQSEITSDLIAGRLTLFEAAAGFRAVRRARERYLEPVRPAFPGQTEEERLCRQVLVAVEQRLLDKPEQAAVRARLEKELQDHLRRHGAVQLPAPPRLAPPPF